MKLLLIFFVVAAAEKAQDVKKEQTKAKRALRTLADYSASDGKGGPVSNLQLLVPMVVVDDGIVNPGRGGNPQIVVVDDGDDNDDEGTQQVVVAGDGDEEFQPVAVVIDDDEGKQAVVLLDDDDNDSLETLNAVEKALAAILPHKSGGSPLLAAATQASTSPDVLAASHAVSSGEYANTCPACYVANSLESSKLDSGNQKNVGQSVIQWIKQVIKERSKHGQEALKKNALNELRLVQKKGQKAQSAHANQNLQLLQKSGANYQSENQEDQLASTLISSLDWNKIGQIILQADKTRHQHSIENDQRLKQKAHRLNMKLQDEDTKWDGVDRWLDQLAQRYNQPEQSVKQRSHASGLGQIEKKADGFWDASKQKWKQILHRADKNEHMNSKHQNLNFNNLNNVWDVTGQAWVKQASPQKQRKQKSQDSGWETVQLWDKRGQSSEQRDRTHEKEQQFWNPKDLPSRSLFWGLLNRIRRSINDA